MTYASLAVLPDTAEPYRVSFSITGPGAAGLHLLSQVEARVREWLAGRSQTPQFDLDAPEGTWSSDDYEISIDRDSLGDAGYVSFKWECEDLRAPGFWLRLDMNLATEGGPVAVSVESYFLERDDAEPPALLTGPPPLVHELLDAFDCFMGEERIDGEVTSVSEEEAPQFASGRILSPERQLPIIAVSQDRQGKTAVDPARLQQYLSGVASVAAYDRTAPPVLWQHLGRALACHGGDVRLYWPGCALQDEGSVRRVWRWREVGELGFHRLMRQLQGECLRRLAQAFGREMFESVRQTVEREKLRLRYQEQESAKWSVGSADAVQINEQERILAELKRQLGRKTEEIKEINAENASLQTRLAEEQRIREPGDDDSNELISQLEATIKNLTLRVNEIEAENRKLQTKYSSDTTMREGRDNNERVGQGLWGLRTGLTHFVSRRFVTRYPGGEALRELRRIFPDGPEREELEQEAQFGNRYFDWMDAAALLKVVASSWSDVFRQHFKPAERDCVHDLRRVRNNWAHQRPFSNDKAYHALDSMHRLLSAMGASQAREIDNLKVEQFKVTSNGQISQIVSGPSSPVGAVR